MTGPHVPHSEPPPCIVRPASGSDVPALEVLDAASWTSTETPAPLESLTPWRLPIEDTLVAVTDDASIGGYVVIGQRTSLPSNRHVGRVRAIAVRSDCRGRGVAARLLAAAEGVARTRGIRKLSLTVLGTNAPARRLYERAGYVIEGVLAREFELGGERVDDVIMAKWIDEV